MVKSAVVILFNHDKTEFLVGKESQWIRDIPGLSSAHLDFIRNIFSRLVQNEKSHDDPVELAYYNGQLQKFLNNDEIMGILNNLSETQPARITFGDIKYKRSESGKCYSYTNPQYLPKGRQVNFPRGGIKEGVDSTLKDAAWREFFEESGVNLKVYPFDINKLIDSGISNKGYQIFYYEPTNQEELEARANIAAKNMSNNAELHELEFVKITDPNVEIESVRAYNKITGNSLVGGKRRKYRYKKTRSSKQRWTRTRKLQH